MSNLTQKRNPKTYSTKWYGRNWNCLYVTSYA